MVVKANRLTSSFLNSRLHCVLSATVQLENRNRRISSVFFFQTIVVLFVFELPLSVDGSKKRPLKLLLLHPNEPPWAFSVTSFGFRMWTRRRRRVERVRDTSWWVKGHVFACVCCLVLFYYIYGFEAGILREVLRMLTIPSKSASLNVVDKIKTMHKPPSRPES